MIHITILGCRSADRRRILMAESSTNSQSGLFNIRSTLSNEHLVFAETLRDWRDPLLHGYEPAPALLCPRCITCKCESLKDLRSTHHHIHDSSCSSFHHRDDQIKSPNKKHTIKKFKRRAISHDPSMTALNTSPSSLSLSSIIKSKSAEHTPIKKSRSKIPIRISTPSTSEISPSSSFILNRSLNKKTKIPRLILTQSLPTTIKALCDRDR